MHILNSQQEYVQLAYHVETLPLQDIKIQHEQAALYKTERYVVYNDRICIGIVEYGYESPRQQLPWINLLCIDTAFSGKGYAKKVFEYIEQNMYKMGATEVLLAVHATNKKALQFWRHLGFYEFEERRVDRDTLISCKKKLVTVDA